MADGYESFDCVCSGVKDVGKIRAGLELVTMEEALEQIKHLTLIYRPTVDTVIKWWYSGVIVPGKPKHMINPLTFPFNIERLPEALRFGNNIKDGKNFEVLLKLVQFFVIHDIDTREYRLDKILHTAAFTLRYCCVCGKIYKVSKKKLNEIPLCSRGCKTKFNKGDINTCKFVEKCVYCGTDVKIPFYSEVPPVCDIACELTFLRNVIDRNLKEIYTIDLNNYIDEYNVLLNKVYEYLDNTGI